MERVLWFSWQLPTRLPIVHTSDMGLPTPKYWWKILARMATISFRHQQFANIFADWFFCAVHTHQFEFASTRFPTLVCHGGHFSRSFCEPVFAFFVWVFAVLRIFNLYDLPVWLPFFWALWLFQAASNLINFVWPPLSNYTIYIMPA